jgi:hypothetical protein
VVSTATGAAQAQFFDPFSQFFAPQAPAYAPQAPASRRASRKAATCRIVFSMVIPKSAKSIGFVRKSKAPYTPPVVYRRTPRSSVDLISLLSGELEPCRVSA